jgi:DeoR/GlpR family transcriptional regulator of sugar metabolism
MGKLTTARRREEILLALKSESPGRLTAKDLAELFKVSERTIRRDIWALVDDNPTIDVFYGNGGGYQYTGINERRHILSIQRVEVLKRAMSALPEDAEEIQKMIDEWS